MENVVMVLFEVESEAYQALAELKRDPINEMYTISQMGLVQKQGGQKCIEYKRKGDIDGFKNWIEETKFTVGRLKEKRKQYKNDIG